MKQLFAIFLLFWIPAFAQTAKYVSGEDGVLLPNPTYTPGSIDPRVTQATIQSTICQPNYTKTVRNVPAKIKKQVYAEYGATENHPKAEVDHLVSLEIGGSNDITNLWPQEYEPAVIHGAHEKDILENYLHREICGGEMTLKDAQTCIATDWYMCAREHGITSSNESMASSLARPPKK